MRTFRTKQTRLLIRQDTLWTLERLADTLATEDGRKPSISTLVNAAIKTALNHQDEFEHDVTDCRKRWQAVAS
jgi:hypothetical protein